MSYTAAVDHLLGLTPELSPTAPRRKFDLEHMRTLARALGDPQSKFPSILIAGTNGKGSTAATLASILTTAGYRTGLYTSPHLTRVTERIRVSIGCHSERREESPHSSPVASHLTEIPESDFARLYFQVDSTANQLLATNQLPDHPSFFETITALAFFYFAEQHLDIAVLEVGLGGRLDATNIVTPLLSVITDIALDHQDYLGATIAEIAREKAGILRAGGTLITLPQHPDANNAIGEAAIALDVRGISAAEFVPGRTATYGLPAPDALHPNHYHLTIAGEHVDIVSPLPGEHQQRNIALAIASALELRNQHGYNIPNSAIVEGIANTSWPGRLELLPPNLLLDVAHNPAGAWTLRAAIATLSDSQPRTLIFSCLRDKDLTEISRILFPLFDAPHQLILAPIDNPRAAPLDSLLAAAAALSIPAVAAPSATEALAIARALTPTDGIILATGSIYLIGALREAALEPAN
jgi:dihydrofolate synthase/folylpolyglutamate synthase